MRTGNEVFIFGFRIITFSIPIIKGLRMSEELLVILFALGIFLYFVFRLNKPLSRGDRGEIRVARRLRKLKGEEYEVLNDLLIRTDRGSSQIDHIIISLYGIFVIETKNYSGWIHGHENSEYWTQSIYKQKTKFRNPIKQNWSHIYALKDVLSDYKQATFYPIIVFAGRAELKNIESSIPVIYDHQIIRIIKDQIRSPNLSYEQIKGIAVRLSEVNIQDRKARRQHVRQVRNQVHERRRNERLKICPRCGGSLKLINGKYGKFYGCSNYPRCKYKLRY